MKQILHYSILIFIPFLSIAQQAKFEILPFVNGITSIKDGLIEAGPELNWYKLELVDIGGVKIPRKSNHITIKPLLRLPLTNKSENIVQIDRFSSTWKGILALQYTIDNSKSGSQISRHSFGVQFEYGYVDFKYYPSGRKTEENISHNSSYAFEFKYIGFFTRAKVNAYQLSPQFRLRYTYDWIASSEVGVINPPNSNGVITTSNLVVDPPSIRPIFSPAFSLQVYSGGKRSFSHSPTIYYDFIGKNGKENPFGNLNRFRLESWIFFYPLINDNPNVKIGISPFISIRTAGTDAFNKFEYGGMFTVKFGTSFLQFL